MGVESAIKPAASGRGVQIEPAKVRRDSQGSLPKIAINPYLDDNATEL
jgi:hypothetical protein